MNAASASSAASPTSAASATSPAGAGARPWDALIVGGGPAGLAAAIALVRRGARVAVLEQRRYPHDKLCGEFLSGEARGELERLGVWPRLVAAGAAPIAEARITAPGAPGREWRAALPPGAVGISRRVLDAELAAAAREAGAEVLEGRTAAALSGGPGRYRVAGLDDDGRPFELAARAVLAGHGKRSRFDRALARPARPSDFVALKAHFHGPSRAGRVELHGFAGGYCGLAGVERELVNVCLLMTGRAFRAAGARPEGVIARLRRENAALDAWFAQAERADARWLAIAQIDFGPRRAVEGGVLALGDAAGLISPLAGDGMAMALRSGLLAAEHAARALDAGGAGADGAGYAQAWASEFGTRLRLAAWLRALMLRPRMLRGGLAVLARVPRLGRWLVAATRGDSGLVESGTG
jgi:flavin-dependent dehydrogenase